MCKMVFLWGVAMCSMLGKGLAQYPGFTPVSGPGAFKARFAEASEKTSSLQCDFTQEKNLSVLSEKIISHGKFWFRKENDVRMEYLQPFQYLMVLSGNRIYIKDGDKENSVSTKSNKLFSQINQLVIDCVRGTAVSNPDFSVRIFEATQSYLIELSPTNKNMKDLFKTVVVVIDKKDGTASKINMLETSGDNTVITFLHKELNTPLPDALFTLH